MLIGIDCGGSKNELVLTENDGRVLRRAVAAGSNVSEYGVDEACRRIIGQIGGLLEGLGGLNTPLEALTAGLAGGGVPATQQAVSSRLREAMPHLKRARCFSDMHTALYAGVGAGDGMALIAGTGSSALVRHDGEYTRVGGWGHLIDDAGSGFSLGREALNAALRATDGRGGDTLLAPLVNDKLGDDVRNRIPQLYQGGKKTIAAFAPLVFQAAQAGDKPARDILCRAADELALMIRAGVKLISSPRPRVALAGGLWGAPMLLEMVKERVKDLCDPRPMTEPPSLGAALASAELASLPAGELFRETFMKSLFPAKSLTDAPHGADDQALH